MFNKLLSNLPFNPSLITQVSFYAQRLKKESSIRRLGLLFFVLAFSLQMFAIIAPPKQSIARVGNDIVPGGFSSAAQITRYCNNNDFNLKTILAKFGIPCQNLNAEIVTIGSRSHDGQLYSMGRLPYGKTGETPYPIEGVGTVFMRPLWSWDTGGQSHYRALKVGNIFTAPFYILLSCGNLVTIGAPKPPPPPPPPAPPPPAIPPCTPEACLKLSKKARNSTQDILDANGSTAKPKDFINYSLIVKNTGNSTVNDFTIEENLTDVLEYSDLIDAHGGTKYSKNIIRWPSVDIKAGETVTKFLTVKVKSNIPKTPSPKANPGSFDLVMTNVYGNAINIKVPGGVIKKTEKAVTTLPNTGPGTTLAVGFGVTAIVAYFFARSRLLAKELEVVRKDYSASGGT